MKFRKLNTLVAGLICVFFGGHVIQSNAAPKVAGVSFRAVDFDLESAPGTVPIQVNGSVLEAITNQSWVAYTNFNFGEEANRFSIEAATPGAGGRIELRLGSPTGLLVGAVDVRHTGSDVYYKDFAGVLTQSVSGTNNLYLRFVDVPGQGGYLFKAKNCLVSREVPALGKSLIADEDLDGVPALLEYATGMHPQSKDALPFSLKPETNDLAVDFQVRVRAETGLVTRLLVRTNLTSGSWQAVTLLYTNGNWQTDSPDMVVSPVVTNGGGLFSLRLENAHTGQSLFARLAAEKREGRLSIYPPVPGFSMTASNWANLPKDNWTESPYYTYGIQKLSQLNHTNYALATNWLTPFAFFTRCRDYNPATNNAYFDEFFGSWSHTYCNFELDPFTPIVIKIHRRTQAEMNALGIVSSAPKGAITNAVAYPTRKVDSCQIINGDVYVTMRHPGLISVDIDQQMDGRNAPRNRLSGSNSEVYPFRSEALGSHAVSIFANPFIEDKPNTNDTVNVRVVQPGQRPPTSFTQPILYFAPGVHRFSVDTNGNDREWVDADRVAPINGKTYYIPGDAIVYGNFSDGLVQSDSKNIRFFGHGTLSGAKIPHEDDISYTNTLDGKELRMLWCNFSENVIFEGLTLANPPGHTVNISGSSSQFYQPNYIKWCKSISWRVNNDGMTVSGNGYIEDCFMRHQDDGSYIGGMAIRRTTYWTDVNGTPFRGSFMCNVRGADYHPSYPKDLIIEDCDVLYARVVYVSSDTDRANRNGVIAQWTGDNPAVYADGTTNTAQHVIFRNFTVSDPKPQRQLLGFWGETNFFEGAIQNKLGDWSGLRFENVNYMYPHTWGWPNRLIGDADTRIRFWTFKNVRINGQLLNAALLANPAVFKTTNVSNMIFEQ